MGFEFKDGYLFGVCGFLVCGFWEGVGYGRIFGVVIFVEIVLIFSFFVFYEINVW